MTQLIVDGFGHYGNSTDGTFDPAYMLAGAWAEIGSGSTTITTLPWDVNNDDLYMGALWTPGQNGNRRVLPASYSTPLFFSFYLALSNLPSGNGYARLLQFRDGGNNVACFIRLDSTGAITLCDANNTTLITTAGPVLVAETAVHVELKVQLGDAANGIFELRVNGTTVLNSTTLTMSNGGPMAQFVFFVTPGLFGIAGQYYISHLIVRDTNGTYNNGFMGDRKVATLLVDNDDAAHQGWTKRPIQRFGLGVLDLTHGTGTMQAGVYADASAETDLGSVDFTWETQIRWKSKPTGAFKAQIFGKWSEGDNNRSYRLYLAGPSLNNGELCWEKSTDGTAGTASLDFHFPWEIDIGRWYHVAVERVSGVTTVYIDGKPLGASWSDSAAYYNGTGHASIGCQMSGVSSVANAHVDGWFDENRFTKGSYRYGGGFTPPTDSFPRGSGSDAQWSDVYWLSGWDLATIADESGFSRVLTAVNGAAAINPGDGVDGVNNYLVLNKLVPDDDSFIEAALIPATNTLNLTALPSNGETVTLGTTDGVTPAVYTFVTTLASAFDVLIDPGSDIDLTLENLMNAVLAGPGAGTVYGTGTTANNDVSATKPTGAHQMIAEALIFGTVGNSIASTETLVNGSWLSGATLAGGQDIPAYSAFGMQNLPAGASTVDSVTLVRRSWKTDAGTETSKASLVGGAGGVIAGGTVSDTTVPILYHDMFEEDPDNPGNPLTPTAVNGAKFKIDRLT